MKAIAFSEKVSYKVTINKAHRILATLQKVENQKKNDLDFEKSKYDKEKSVDIITVAMATIVTSNQVELEKLIESRFDKKIEKIMLAIELLEDLKDIKENIFSFNVENGISQKLSFIEKKKYLVKLYEEMLTLSGKFEDDSTDDKIKAMAAKLSLLSNKEFDSSDMIEIDLNFWDKKIIEDDLKKLKSEISAYEDEIMVANASNLITIRLFKSTASFLGLE